MTFYAILKKKCCCDQGGPIDPGECLPLIRITLSAIALISCQQIRTIGGTPPQPPYLDVEFDTALLNTTHILPLISAGTFTTVDEDGDRVLGSCSYQLTLPEPIILRRYWQPDCSPASLAFEAIPEFFTIELQVLSYETPLLYKLNRVRVFGSGNFSHGALNQTTFQEIALLPQTLGPLPATATNILPPPADPFAAPVYLGHGGTGLVTI